MAIHIGFMVLLVFLENKCPIIFTIDLPQIINLASQFNNPYLKCKYSFSDLDFLFISFMLFRPSRNFKMTSGWYSYILKTNVLTKENEEKRRGTEERSWGNGFE